MSIFEQVLCWKVEYDQLDNFINENYAPVNGNFEILAHEELNNDTIKEFIINIDDEMDDYSKQMIDRGNFMFQTQNILNELSRKGILPMTKGKLMVEVCY